MASLRVLAICFSLTGIASAAVPDEMTAAVSMGVSNQTLSACVFLLVAVCLLFLLRSRTRDRRSLDETMKDAEAIRVVTGNMPVSLINFDPDFAETRSRGGCRLFRPVENGRQITIETWFGKAAADIRKQISEVMSGVRSAVDIRVTSIYKSDSGTEYRILAKRFVGREGARPEFVGTMYDLSADLHAKEKYLNGLLDTVVQAGCHLFMYYPSEQRCTVPAATAALFKCRMEYFGMPGSFADDFVNIQDRDLFFAAYQKINDGEATAAVEFRNHTKTMRCRVTLNSITRDANGRTTEVIGFVQNQSEAMLREQKLDRLVSSLSRDYIAVLSFDLRTDEVDLMRTDDNCLHSLLDFLVSTRTYHAFMSFYLENMIASEDRAATAARFDGARVREELALRKTYTVRYVRNWEGKRSHMEARFVLAAVDGEGAETCVLAFRIVDEEVRREEELRIALAADKAKSVFLATMSHEIRTPLNAVIGFSDLLKTGLVPPAETREYIDSINLSGKSLLTLINDILDLSKLDAGQMKLVRTDCCLPVFLRDVLRIFISAAKEKGLTLLLHCPEDLPCLSVDASRIRQILINLIGNAVKFTKEGRVTVRTAFYPADHGDGTLIISVADTGCGIPEKFRADLFKPFSQANVLRDAHAFKGTGLGLAISQRLAHAMGGDLTVDSLEGSGSVFTMTLSHTPIAKTKGSESIVRHVVPQAVLFVRKVLIVDDVPMNLKVLSAIVARCGVQTITAGSGAEALKYLRDHVSGIDAVFTDLWMPGMNGTELASKIRATPGLEHLPIAVVTADVEVCKSVDVRLFSMCLTKPITIEKVSALLAGINLRIAPEAEKKA